MDKQPSNWIEGMSMEVKEKRKKDVILNIVVWLGLMPVSYTHLTLPTILRV